MKRDFDLIRQILRDAEGMPAMSMLSNIAPLGGTAFRYEGRDPQVVAEHVQLLIEAGLLNGKVSPGMEGGAYIQVQRLTWKGHDFLDAMKDESIWAQAKESILKPVGGVAFDVLLDWLKWKMSEKLGLPGN